MILYFFNRVMRVPYTLNPQTTALHPRASAHQDLTGETKPGPHDVFEPSKNVNSLITQFFPQQPQLQPSDRVIRSIPSMIGNRRDHPFGDDADDRPDAMISSFDDNEDDAALSTVMEEVDDVHSSAGSRRLRRGRSGVTGHTSNIASQLLGSGNYTSSLLHSCSSELLLEGIGEAVAILNSHHRSSLPSIFPPDSASRSHHGAAASQHAVATALLHRQGSSQLMRNKEALVRRKSMPIFNTVPHICTPKPELRDPSLLPTENGCQGSAVGSGEESNTGSDARCIETMQGATLAPGEDRELGSLAAAPGSPSPRRTPSSLPRRQRTFGDLSDRIPGSSQPMSPDIMGAAERSPESVSGACVVMSAVFTDVCAEFHVLCRCFLIKTAIVENYASQLR